MCESIVGRAERHREYTTISILIKQMRGAYCTINTNNISREALRATQRGELDLTCYSYSISREG